MSGTDAAPPGVRDPAGFDWVALAAAWREHGHAVVPSVLDAAACRALVALDADPSRFRSRVVMERHRFGRGEYAYFARPLPPAVAYLRRTLYPHLAPWARRLRADLGAPDGDGEGGFPPTLDAYLARCRAAGQTRPTPLLLHYRAGDYNCLHRDLYGELVFPVQATVFLSERGADYEGGEFVLVENRPRQQARATVLTPARGDLVLFPVADRPVAGRRGWVRASVRHGVSPVRAGERWALGIIFHDAA